MNHKILSVLPDAQKMKSSMRIMAVMDAILSPDWEYRYYSYDAYWGSDEIMASMRGSDGEHYFALFRGNNVIIKGLERGCPWIHKRISGVKGEFPFETLLPGEFCDFFSQPAFLPEETSFCIWQIENENWNSLYELKAGELSILESIIHGAEAYASWAKDYYEVELDVVELERIFQGQPLNKEQCMKWNPKLNWEEFLKEYESIL